jgi:hypothetical protein
MIRKAYVSTLWPPPPLVTHFVPPSSGAKLLCLLFKRSLALPLPSFAWEFSGRPSGLARTLAIKSALTKKDRFLVGFMQQHRVGIDFYLVSQRALRNCSDSHQLQQVKDTVAWEALFQILKAHCRSLRSTLCRLLEVWSLLPLASLCRLFGPTEADVEWLAAALQMAALTDAKSEARHM